MLWLRRSTFSSGAHHELSFLSLPHPQVICCTGHSRWYLCPTAHHCLSWKKHLWVTTALNLKPSPRSPESKSISTSPHPIKKYKVVQTPSAIFRSEGSKSITEGRHWDSWMSTSSSTGVIMHLYLSRSSSLCPYRSWIHFSVIQNCILL